MRRAILASAVALMMAASGPALSDDAPALTAGDLQELCAGTDVQTKACRYYILGLAEGFTMGLSVADKKMDDSRACLPPGTSQDEMMSEVKKTLGELLTAYPDDKMHPAAGLVGAVLANHWPCRKP